MKNFNNMGKWICNNNWEKQDSELHIQTYNTHKKTSGILSLICVYCLIRSSISKDTKSTRRVSHFCPNTQFTTLWTIILTFKKKKPFQRCSVHSNILSVSGSANTLSFKRRYSQSVSLSNPTRREEKKDVTNIISSFQGGGLSWMFSCNPTDEVSFSLLKYFALGF